MFQQHQTTNHPRTTQYLLALTILAAYALHRNNALSLPIPNILAALTIALPSLAGVAIETATSLVTSANNSATSTSNSLTTNSKKPRISPARATQILHLTLAVLLVYETVVATLAGEHVRASDCGLHEVWQGMFHRKDGERIRAIQDALRCCGFASTRDMAWPFPGSGRDAGACAARYDGAGTVSRCLDGLRGEERKVGWMLMAVPLGVFLWKVSCHFSFLVFRLLLPLLCYMGIYLTLILHLQCLLLAVPTSGSYSWLPSGIQLPGDGERNERRRIEFRDAEEAGEEDSIVDEVRRLNNDSQLASTVESMRTRPSVLLPRDNTWASASSGGG